MSNTVDRRSFLQASLTGAVAVAAGGSYAWGDDKKPYGPFRMGVQSYSFREFNVDQALQRTKALGLEWVEFTQRHVPVASTPEQIKAIRKLCTEYGVTPIAYGVHDFKKDNGYNRKVFDFAKELGIKYVSANPDPDSFDSLDKLCEEYKIAIAIHPHGPAHRGAGGEAKLDRWWNADIIMKAVKDHHPLIGTCIDTGHVIRAAIVGKKLDPAAEIRTMGKHNFGIHLKDNDNSTDTNVVFGKGVLDVVSVLTALKEVGFTGYVSLEYEANPKDPSPDMAACLEVVRQAIAKLPA